MEQLFKTFVDTALQPLVVTIAVPFVVNILKTAYKAMPKWMMPLAATVVGPALAWLANVAGMMDISMAGGAMAGLASIGVRELTNQLITKKVTNLTE